MRRNASPPSAALASLKQVVSPRAVLARLLDAPELARGVRALEPPAFSALVRHVGVEDAGELLALATAEQLVASFDEDLFANARPGERERFDRERFATWLEVLLEAGEAAAAARFVELSEDFAVHALGSLVLVLDFEALRVRMLEDPDGADAVDKALESSLSEEIEGYLLIARVHEGWDAALSLILALDRDHRAYLERILDRCAALAASRFEDLEALADVLNDAESLEEQVEADRELRRAALGYVEPRAARTFLTLAKQPVAARATALERDPVTAAYFRELDRERTAAAVPAASESSVAALLTAVSELGEDDARSAEPSAAPEPPLVEALRLLQARDGAAFDARMEELVYLANVVLAGEEADEAGNRYRPLDAAQRVLTVVTYGARRELRGRVTPERACELLRVASADRLFRVGSAVGPAGD